MYRTSSDGLSEAARDDIVADYISMDNSLDLFMNLSLSLSLYIYLSISLYLGIYVLPRGMASAKHLSIYPSISIYL